MEKIGLSSPEQISSSSVSYPSRALRSSEIDPDLDALWSLRFESDRRKGIADGEGLVLVEIGIP